MGNTALKKSFIEKCKTTLNLADNRRINEYYYTSLPFCVLDAVFSIGAHYRSTENVVERYANMRGINRYTFEDETGICTLHHFIDDVEKEQNIEIFAREILKNRQRTSPKNGILKAEACYQIAKIMQRFGVSTLDDFRTLPECTLKDLSDKILKVKGQSSGIMLRYLLMLTGDDNTCKPDRQIRDFLESIEIKNITDYEIQELFEQSTEELCILYPHLTVRRLDNLIWNYQRALNAKRLKKVCKHQKTE